MLLCFFSLFILNKYHICMIFAHPILDVFVKYNFCSITVQKPNPFVFV
jgi:hypothetical protein